MGKSGFLNRKLGKNSSRKAILLKSAVAIRSPRTSTASLPDRRGAKKASSLPQTNPAIQPIPFPLNSMTTMPPEIG